MDQAQALTTAEAARYLTALLGQTITAHRLGLWRLRHQGPPCYLTADGTYRYVPQELERWACQRRRRTTGGTTTATDDQYLRSRASLDRTHVDLSTFHSALATCHSAEENLAFIIRTTDDDPPAYEKAFRQTWRLYATPTLPREQRSTIWAGTDLLPRGAALEAYRIACALAGVDPRIDAFTTALHAVVQQGETT